MDASPQHDEFFQAILDEPDSLVPRLVYADWLDERGDPRGEFIRVQCELAEMPETNSRRRALITRQYELLHQHKHIWHGEVFRALAHTPLKDSISKRHGSVRRWEFRRGFVEFLSVDGVALRFYPDALLRIGPVREMHVRTSFHVVAEVLDSPFLAQLRRLTLFFADGVRFDARHVADHPAIEELDSLGISNPHDQFHAATAAAFERLPNLSAETRSRWAKQRAAGNRVRF